MYGIMLVVVLIITGGVIAFIGDRLGTKVGKKKLSLFGLRPRHTSIVVTIITGIMITTITFTILSVASENVRLALFGMEKLKKQIVTTQKELDDKNISLQQTTENLKKIKLEYEKSEKELEEAQERSRILAMEQKRLWALNRSLANSNRNLQSLKNSLEVENNRLEEVNQNLRLGIETIREHPIVYRVGELLGSGTIKHTNNVSEAEKELTGLISLANTKIISTLGNNTKSSVRIYPNEYEDALNSILQNKNGTVIRLVVAGNVVNGDPIITNIRNYPNRLIYPSNTLVYENYYDLNEDLNIDTIIGDFLRGVNRAAVKQGLLPNPLTGTVGVISGSQMIELEDALSKTSGRILLQAYAENNTNIIDPLRLDIIIKQ